MSFKDIHFCIYIQIMQLCFSPDHKINNNELFQSKDIDNIEYGGDNEIHALLDNNLLTNLDDILANLEGFIDEKQTEESDWKMCQYCNVLMEPMQFTYKCPNCGLNSVNKKTLGGEYSESVKNNYNTNNKCPTTLKIVGQDSRKYRMAFYIFDSNYKHTQFNNTLRQLNRFNDNSKTIKFKQTILKETAEYYSILQSHNIVRRGKSRIGTLGACLYYICLKNHIVKKYTELAEYLNIEKSYISKGDKKLKELGSNNQIDIPSNDNIMMDFLEKYFQILDISSEYKQFTIDLINESCSIKMKGENNSKMSTKCAGAIYILGMQKKFKYTKIDIAKNCVISKSTFIRYYTFILHNRKQLNHIFIKHNIPILKKNKKKKKNKRVKKK